MLHSNLMLGKVGADYLLNGVNLLLSRALALATGGF